MNDNARKWVEALRSGEYKQGKMVLHNLDDDTYCCLGVACDLFDKENPNTLVRETNNYVYELFSGVSSVLPHDVQIWLGLSDRTGYYLKEQIIGCALSEDNDEGKTFLEIADIIESEPEELFVE